MMEKKSTTIVLMLNVKNSYQNHPLSAKKWCKKKRRKSCWSIFLGSYWKIFFTCFIFLNFKGLSCILNSFSWPLRAGLNDLLFFLSPKSAEIYVFQQILFVWKLLARRCPYFFLYSPNHIGKIFHVLSKADKNCVVIFLTRKR